MSQSISALRHKYIPFRKSAAAALHRWFTLPATTYHNNFRLRVSSAQRSFHVLAALLCDTVDKYMTCSSYRAGLLVLTLPVTYVYPVACHVTTVAWTITLHIPSSSYVVGCESLIATGTEIRICRTSPDVPRRSVCAWLAFRAHSDSSEHKETLCLTAYSRDLSILGAIVYAQSTRLFKVVLANMILIEVS